MNQVRLKRVARVAYGLGQPPPTSDSGVPIIRATNISRGRIVAEGLIFTALDDLPLERAPLLKPGEILVVRSGAYTGDSAIVRDEWVGAAPGYDLRVTVVNADPRYVAWALQGDHAIQQIEVVKSRAAQPHLNAEELGDLVLHLPDEKRQTTIADYLDTETARIDVLVEKKRLMLDLLAERSFALISEVLVPPSAPLTRLGRFATVQTGLTVDSSRDSEDDAITLPYLRVANVLNGRLALDSVSDITVPRHIADRTRLRVGDVLMTEGGDLDKLGRGTVWRGEIGNCLHQNHVFAVRTDPSLLDPEYLALLTQTAHGRAYFERTGSRITNLASTSSAKVLDFPIPVLSLHHQRDLVRQAASATSSLGQLGVRLASQLKLLAERRQAVITAAVTGRLDTGRIAA